MPRPYICKSCLSRLSPVRQPLSRPKSTTTKASTNTPLSSLSPSTLSYYWDTHPPTPSQLLTSNTLFTPSPPHSPLKLFSASKFHQTPLSSTVPEVAFLGRSNVGKSSLLNALMGVKNLCWTSSKPGKTREMNGFGVGGRKGGEWGDSKVVVLDMPGYGKGSRGEWGVEILKYLRGRRQLRRTFLLIDAHHGIKPIDHHLLSLLRQSAIPHQIILSKIDKVLLPTGSSGHKRIAKKGVSAANIAKLRTLLEELRYVVQPPGEEGPGALGEILTCSSETFVRGMGLGMEGVRWAVCSAVGIDGMVEGRREVVPEGGFEEPPPLYREVEEEEEVKK